MSTSLTAPDEAWLAEAACVAPDEGPVAVIVVNPCCNHAVLIRTRTGQWRVATLDKFRRAGFLPVGSGRPAESHVWAWSGVVYHAFDPQRALAEEEFVSLELAVQAIWVYCAYINSEAERDSDPVIGDGYGCCFLRAARSRLVNPRPQETGQHRSMRDAVVETSGLPAHLTLAMDALKEAGGK